MTIVFTVGFLKTAFLFQDHSHFVFPCSTFGVSPESFKVEPDEVVQVEVSFHPREKHSYSGSLYAEYETGETEVLYVQV